MSLFLASCLLEEHDEKGVVQTIALNRGENLRQSHQLSIT